MRKTPIVLVIALVVVSVGAVMVLTYPQTAIQFPVSFSIGADRKDIAFDVPVLHKWVRVEVVVNSGSSLWTANIVEHDDVLWTYSTHQGSQTTYTSEWIAVPNGHYNFTYATAGLGSLEAEVTVKTKGGVW